MSKTLNDFQNIEKDLENLIGSEGLDFLLPQVGITRMARNLPKNMVDNQLHTENFYAALQLIEAWVSPMGELMQALIEDEQELRQLQAEARVALDQENIKSWQEVQQIPKLKQLFGNLQNLKNRIITEREQMFKIANRFNVTDLLGLILYPYSGHKTLPNAIKFAESYFGPNIKYRKLDKYADALIYVKAGMNVFENKDNVSSDPNATEQEELVSYEKFLENPDPDVQRIRDIYFEAKEGNFAFKGFSQRDMSVLVFKVLERNSGLTPSERSEFMSAPYYMEAIDGVRCDYFMQWLEGEIKGVEAKYEVLEEAKREKLPERAKANYLLGLNFLDKHVNSEILGNIPKTSFALMDRVLFPFVELKQNNINMESSQFEILHFGLPDNAWVYDFTNVKTEILRSTMLLISDRQPKFDLLESCQALVNGVLSGRVDRNDYRSQETNNFIYTNLLPKENWDYIGKMLMNILKETLIDEEARANWIVRKVFAEEDRSHLVSSKKFNPIFYIEINWKLYEKLPNKKEANLPSAETISIWKAPNFDFQYRFAQAAGYNWYYIENDILRTLVLRSHNLSHIDRKEVLLKRVIYNIDNTKYIVYFQPSEDLSKLQALAFREVEEFEDGISPVEVLFRPKKFIERSPEKNGLVELLINARATDPKDLESLISSLDQQITLKRQGVET